MEPSLICSWQTRDGFLCQRITQIWIHGIQGYIIHGLPLMKNIYLVLNNILSGDPLTCPFLVCPSIWYVGCIKCTTLHLSWWCHWRILGLIRIYLVWCTIQQLVQLHIWEARLDRCKYPMYYGGWVSPALPECPTGGCPSIEQYVTHPSPSYAQSCNHVHYHVPRSTYHVARSIRHMWHIDHPLPHYSTCCCSGGVA